MIVIVGYDSKLSKVIKLSELVVWALITIKWLEYSDKKMAKIRIGILATVGQTKVIGYRL